MKYIKYIIGAFISGMLCWFSLPIDEGHISFTIMGLMFMIVNIVLGLVIFFFLGVGDREEWRSKLLVFLIIFYLVQTIWMIQFTQTGFLRGM